MELSDRVRSIVDDVIESPSKRRALLRRLEDALAESKQYPVPHDKTAKINGVRYSPEQALDMDIDDFLHLHRKEDYNLSRYFRPVAREILKLKSPKKKAITNVTMRDCIAYSIADSRKIKGIGDKNVQEVFTYFIQKYGIILGTNYSR